MASLCWCSMPDFAWENEVIEPEGAATGVYWCTIIVGRLTFKQLDRWRADISSVLPPAAWYFGATEHHVGEVGDSVHYLHGCIAVLVAFAKPYSLVALRHEIDRSDLRLGRDSKLSIRAGPSIPSKEDARQVMRLVKWTWSRLSFIARVATVPGDEGLGRGVFGYAGIINVLEKQFGPPVSFMAAEMALERYCSDEGDGVLPAGGGFHCENPAARKGETIYVKGDTPDESLEDDL